MKPLRVSGYVTKIGNRLALRIPVKDARNAGIFAGDSVDAEIRRGVVDAFGLLKDLSYEPFDRRRGGLWRDRT